MSLCNLDILNGYDLMGVFKYVLFFFVKDINLNCVIKRNEIKWYLISEFVLYQFKTCIYELIVFFINNLRDIGYV